MDEFPDPDEEFELMHADEFEVLREHEEFFEQPSKSRKSLEFNNSNSSKPDKQNFQNSERQEISRCNDSFDVDFAPLPTSQNETTKTVNIEANKALNQSSKKRTVEDLFGDIDDILFEDITESSLPKRQKTDKNKENQDIILINHIINLRKLAKERLNPVTVLNKTNKVLQLEYDKNNLSFRVPKYPFVTVTREDGERIYVRCHSEDYEKEEQIRSIREYTLNGLMGDTFEDIWNAANEIVNKQIDSQNFENSDNNDVQDAPDLNLLTEPTENNNSQLWVDMYKPKKYLELLSDESTNRTLLRWIKMWDKVVFNRNIKQKSTEVNAKYKSEGFKYKNNKFHYRDLEMKFDDYGRPEQKVALLCGPPGLGKTTLAHMVARHAGYNVVEVNASDDRSTESFMTILKNATQMHSFIDKENRPNCLIFDEIDGAPQSSIDYLVKFVTGAVTTKSKKGTNKKPEVLKRPIICICNDVYVPALRPLRQMAFVVNFPPTASSRLVERLSEIARHQNIKTNLSAMLALCEKSNNDIRSCLCVLHFFKALNKGISLSDVYKTSIGQKDMHKGLFSVWNSIFQIERAKHANDSIGSNNKTAEIMLQDSFNLKFRMQRILKAIRSFGDYDRVAQGIFENYPNVNVKDSTLAGTCEALDWFCIFDLMSTKIYSLQDYSLMDYLPYGFVMWHFVFGTLARPKLSYSNTSFEVRTKAAKVTAILSEVLKGMQPTIRTYVHVESLRLDILPLLVYIVVPTLRPVNLHLYTPKEKEDLERVVNIMIDYNLNYVQERSPSGTYSYQLDPNIEEAVFFSTLKPTKTLTYMNKQLIAREIEVEKMRRLELCRATSCPKGASEGTKQKLQNQDVPQAVPNHLRKLEAKKIKNSKETVKKDFFGRIIPTASSSGKEVSRKKSDIWFHYKEGYSNAVRRKIKISSLK